MNRVYVEKKKGFDLGALEIQNEINSFLKVESVKNTRLLVRYDAEGFTDEEFGRAVNELFSQSVTENVYAADYKPEAGRVLATEYLPGQYDQRSDFATQNAKLLLGKEELAVKCSIVMLFDGQISDEDFEKIKGYFINRVESMESSLDLPKTLHINYKEIETIETLTGFCDLDKEGLLKLRGEKGINMDIEDLLFCQEYFRKEKKDPTITEIRAFDTYWSDHCRHSTFMTIIDEINVEDSIYKPAILDALNRYYSAKKQMNSDKPTCLMDLATIGMRQMRQVGTLSDMEVSDEVNACSIYADVVVDGKPEEWLFMFKNETHNHPTEIEPFGGASTCLGGGIRDPLSGRSYVHGAIRLTGCGNPLTPYKDTLSGKLPQRKLTRTAAEGYSSYSNQIGLASGHLMEIYDDGFVAKRMECGALVAGARKEDVVRLAPIKGDVIVLLGGNTGRDGCGGATGSSREHDENSLENGGAEVQKGNPAIERNIVRLFRDPVASRMIKKCNDFGAGGVSVAVCELAESLDIDLNKVPLKYGGLDGTEIAISESQERMACMLAAADLDAFVEMANKENLNCVKIAEVTDTGRVIMKWNGKVIVDISAEMLGSGGVRSHTKINVGAPADEKLGGIKVKGLDEKKTLREKWLHNMSDLNVCSKAEIANRFDTTASAGTVFLPYGGANQKTPELGLCMKFPARLGKCDTATLMTVGYNPKLGYFSPFHQGMYAVLESVHKIVAMGGDLSKIKLTFQEYYEKLGTDATRWGKPFAALLGAYRAEDELKIPSIGGKDSMSGTFTDIDVPPSLISFAVTTGDVNRVVSSAFKKAGSRVILVSADKGSDLVPDFDQIRGNLRAVSELCMTGQVLASGTAGFGGVAAAVSNMCFGNGIGFEFADGEHNYFEPDYTAIILEVTETADLSGLNYKELGITTSSGVISAGSEKICLSEVLQASESALEPVFSSAPLVKPEYEFIPLADFAGKTNAVSSKKVNPVVLIPIFPGTNGEYELQDGFTKTGACVKTYLFCNRTPALREKSYSELAAEIGKADIFAIPSGMSAGSEPGGSAKLIAVILNAAPVREALTALIGRGGLVLGIGEGFHALVKVGLLPYGKFSENTEIALEKNTRNKYICQTGRIRITSTNTPWLASRSVGETGLVPVSIQEGRVVIGKETFERLSANGQITAQYVDKHGNPTMCKTCNPTGADYAVESMTDPTGRIFGCTSSFERTGVDVYKNVPGIMTLDILENGVNFFAQKQPQVAVLMGSDSDWKIVKPACDILNKFGVDFEVNVLSAHRTPERTAEYVKALYGRGFKAVIGAAGKAAHLAGVIAAHTTLPVIGLPVAGSSATAGGMDALLATVQMPPGIPVATVAIDGAQNAALLALSIIANNNLNIHNKLEQYRRDMEVAVNNKHLSLQNEVKNAYGKH